jgi:hypothetical protein
MQYFAFIIVLCLYFGCATSRPVVSAGIPATAEAAKAIQTSASFQQAQSYDRSRAISFVDGNDGVYPVVYIGYDMGTHTTRFATLRVREHGVIERQEMRDDGELIWIADK